MHGVIICVVLAVITLTSEALVGPQANGTGQVDRALYADGCSSGKRKWVAAKVVYLCHDPYRSVIAYLKEDDTLQPDDTLDYRFLSGDKYKRGYVLRGENDADLGSTIEAYIQVDYQVGIGYALEYEGPSKQTCPRNNCNYEVKIPEEYNCCNYACTEQKMFYHEIGCNGPNN